MRMTDVHGTPTIVNLARWSDDVAPAIAMLEAALSDILLPAPWLNPKWWTRFGRAVEHRDGETGATQCILTRRGEIVHDLITEWKIEGAPCGVIRTHIPTRLGKISINVFGVDPAFGLYTPRLRKPFAPLGNLILTSLRLLRWTQDHPGAGAVAHLLPAMAVMQSEGVADATSVTLASPHSPTILRGGADEIVIPRRADVIRCVDLYVTCNTHGRTIVEIKPTTVERSGDPLAAMRGVDAVERLMAAA